MFYASTLKKKKKGTGSLNNFPTWLVNVYVAHEIGIGVMFVMAMDWLGTAMAMDWLGLEWLNWQMLS